MVVFNQQCRGLGSDGSLALGENLLKAFCQSQDTCSTLKAISHTAISQTKMSTCDDIAFMNCFCVNSVRLHSVFSVSQKYTRMLKIPALQASCYLLVSSEICIANSFI